MQETVNPAVCPLCTLANKCALVDGGKTCWCFSASLSRSAVDKIPVEQRGLACICHECGTRNSSR